MAINTLPAQVSDNWIQIATTTPTSGSVVSFTSISADWRKLWISTTRSITLTAANVMGVTTNSISAADSYKYTGTQGVDASKYFSTSSIESVGTGSTTNNNINYFFTNVNAFTPICLYTGYGNSSTANAPRAIEFGYVIGLTTAITRLDITAIGTTYAAGNTGAFTLYGTY